jgi:hypothetical protein
MAQLYFDRIQARFSGIRTMGLKRMTLSTQVDSSCISVCFGGNRTMGITFSPMYYSSRLWSHIIPHMLLA